MCGHEADRLVRTEVNKQLRTGRSGCDECDNTGWRAKSINQFMAGWEVCPCWIGKLWEKTYADLQNSKS
jgi:hypothetical protein